MPRVLALTEGYPHGSGLAGVFHVDQFRRLAAEGISLTVAGPTPWVPPGLGRFRRWARYNAGPAREEINGFTVYRPRYPAVPGEARWLRPHWLQAPAILNLPIEKPDLIHAFFALPLGATARLLARHWNVPYLVTCLGGDVTHLAVQSSHHRAMFRKVMRDARVAMANGPSLARQAGELSGVAVRTCPLGVDGSRFAGLPGRSAARAALGLPDDKKIVLFIGSMSVEKGVADLLRALSLLDDATLCCVLVGTGPLLAEAGAMPGCVTAGFQPGTRIPLYLAAADMFVLPSYSEGMPTVVIEAALAGTPVIGSDIPPLRDLLDGGNGMTVPVGDAGALAKAIAALRDDPADAAARAVRLRDLVLAEYEVIPAVESLIDVYAEVLSGGARRTPPEQAGA